MIAANALAAMLWLVALQAMTSANPVNMTTGVPLFNSTNNSSFGSFAFEPSDSVVLANSLPTNVTFRCQYISLSRTSLVWQAVAHQQGSIVGIGSVPANFTVTTSSPQGVSVLTLMAMQSIIGYCFLCFVPETNATSRQGCLGMTVVETASPPSADNSVVLAAVLPIVAAVALTPCCLAVVSVMAVLIFKRINTHTMQVMPSVAGPNKHPQTPNVTYHNPTFQKIPNAYFFVEPVGGTHGQREGTPSPETADFHTEPSAQ